MITLKDGQQEGEPVYFLPTNAFPKEEGLFAGEEYYVYRSPVMLKADRSYRLIVRNRESGFMMQAETDLLGSRTLEYSFIQTRFYNINQYHPESVDYNGSLITSQFEKRVIRLLYYDVKDDKKYLRYVDWRSPYLKFESAQFTDTAQLSDDMFRYFGEHIPLDTSVKRIAVGVDKMLIINDEMVTLFMNYYNYVLNGQYVPSLSSFDQGQGLFASRYNYTFFAMRLKAKTIDSLAHGRFTGHLGFIDSNGNESIQK
jgi:hypothetical protein